MTKQDLFDKAVRGMVQQGKAAVTKSGNCRYVTEDGRRCAIGQLIPDEAYSPMFEGMPVASVFVEMGIHHDYFSFLRDLQIAHDRYIYNDRFIDCFLNACAGIAVKHNLSMPEIP